MSTAFSEIVDSPTRLLVGLVRPIYNPVKQTGGFAWRVFSVERSATGR